MGRRRRRSRRRRLDNPGQKLSKPRDPEAVHAAVGSRTMAPYTPARLSGRPLDDWITSWVFVCIERNATAVAQQSLNLFRSDGDTERRTEKISKKCYSHLKSTMPQRITADSVEVMDHPWLDVLDYVNPLTSRCGLWWLTTAHLQLHGLAFWKLAFDGLRRIAEIWNIPPQNVIVRLDANRIIKQYEYTFAGRQIIFSPDEIVMFRKPSPIDMISGLGNLRAMLNASEVNLRMQEYENALFTNDAMPAAIVSLEGDPSDTQVKTLQADLQSMYGGWHNRGKLGVFGDKISVERLSETNKELQFKDSKRGVVEEIAAGFGIPMNIVMNDGTTFNNMRHGTNFWTRQTIGPLQVTLAETVNSEIMPLYSNNEDDGLSLRKRSEWFTSFGDPTFEDVDADSARVIAEVAAGIRIPNEARAVMKLDNEEWGEEPLLPGGSRFLSEPVPGAVPEGGATEGDKPEEPKPPTINELTAGIERMVVLGDQVTANMLRDALAESLGQPKPSDVEVAPGVVEPIEHAERKEDMEERFGPDETEEPANGEKPKPNDKEKGKEKPKEKPKPKGEDKAADIPGYEDGDIGLVGKAILGLHEKIAFKPFAEDEFDKVFAAKLATLLKDFERSVRENLQTVVASALKAVGEFEYDIPGKEAFIKALFDRDEWAEKLIRTADPFLLQAFNVGADLGFKDIQSSIADFAGLDLGTEHVQNLLQELTKRFSSEVVDVQGDALFATLSKGMKAGERPAQLFKRVSDIYGGEAGDANAERIVRTEMSRAMNAGAQETWKAAGVTQNEWKASVDSCEFCLKVDGDVRPFSTPFVKGGSAVSGIRGGTYVAKYGNVDHPPLHPHCTCTILPVIP